MTKIPVADMKEGDRGFTTPWAFSSTGEFRFDTVKTQAGGTVCVEITLQDGAIVPTESGLAAMAAYEAAKQEKPVAEMAEGEVGYVTHWTIQRNGTYEGTRVRTSPHGTVNVEVVRRGDLIKVTQRGAATVERETADDLEVASMKEGETGFTTEWSVQRDGTVGSKSWLQRRSHGTAVVEVRKVGERVEATYSGLLAALDYLRRYRS